MRARARMRPPADSDSPIKIGLNEVQLGIGLPATVIEPLRLQVPASSHLPIAVEGNLFAPSEAKQLGLVHEVVPPSELLSRSIERARSLARGSREAVAQVKHALRGPALERMEKASGPQLEEWVNAWFSSEAQERVANAVAQITKKR